MTRYSYGGGAADFVFDVAATGYLQLRPATLMVWADQGGGVRVTDLVLDGQVVSTIPVGDTGQVPTFQGPDGYDADLWAATAPDKPRIRLTSNAGVQQIETARAALDQTIAAVQVMLDALGPLEEITSRIDGYIDHGDVSGDVTFSGPTASHWFTATGPTTITLDGYTEGQVCSLLCFAGAAGVTIAEAPNFKVADGLVSSGMLAHSVWVTGGGGEPVVADTTPPPAVADLAVTPDEGGATATASFTMPTDPESTVRVRYRIYPTGSTAPAWPTSGPQYNLTASPIVLTGLAPGVDYTMDLQSYSAGGSASADTATFTTPVPPGWTTYDTLTAALIGADGSRGTSADFTTSGGRTWRMTSGNATTINVASGYITTSANDNAQKSGAFVTGAPTGQLAMEFDFANIAPTGIGYDSELYVTFGQVTGNAYIRLNLDTSDNRQIQVTGDYGTAPVITPGAGFALKADGKSIALANASGRLRVERVGQVLKAYIDGTLILSADYTNATYNSAANTLRTTTGALTFAIKNLSRVSNLEWEVYS